MAIRRLGSEGVVAFGIEADALDEIVARAAAADTSHVLNECAFAVAALRHNGPIAEHHHQQWVDTLNAATKSKHQLTRLVESVSGNLAVCKAGVIVPNPKWEDHGNISPITKKKVSGSSFYTGVSKFCFLSNGQLREMDAEPPEWYQELSIGVRLGHRTEPTDGFPRYTELTKSELLRRELQGHRW